jgi:hypothetical protein
MTNISGSFGSLTLAPVIATSLTASSVVTGIKGSQTSKYFAPSQFLGFNNSSGPQVGDTGSKWLPVVSTVSQATADSQGSSVGGMITVRLTPPTALGGYYSSPLVYSLAPNDIVIVATGTF